MNEKVRGKVLKSVFAPVVNIPCDQFVFSCDQTDMVAKARMYTLLKTWDKGAFNEWENVGTWTDILECGS
jgi:hypothetical protein